MLAEPFTVVPLESTETDVEPTVASTWEVLGPARRCWSRRPASSFELETDTSEGVALTFAWVEVGGAETAEVAEAAGGAVLALVVTVALAAGVLTVAAAVAEGVDDTETFAEAATLGLRNAWEPVCLCRHGERQAPTAHTAAQVAKRKPCLRDINSAPTLSIT